MAIIKAESLKDKDKILLVDCRFNMKEPEEGRALYNEEHLKGSVYVDMDEDMATEPGEHGGRHPLPDLDEFRVKMEKLGVGDDVEVVIYDDGVFPSCARLWFMLQLIGKDCQVVEGGYDELVKAGFETTSEATTPSPSKLTMKMNQEIICDIDYVLKAKDKENSVLVDSRSGERYNGLAETIDSVAGRIPWAVNHFWKDSFDGKFLKDKSELEKDFDDLNKYDEVIFHCGSGVTGAVNLMVYQMLGYKGKLYAGSFSDYITYKGLELVTEGGKKIIL